MKRKLCIAFLTACFLFCNTAVPTVYPYGMADEQKTVLTAEADFGSDAAGEICTVRVLRPGGSTESPETFTYLNQGTLDNNGKISFPVTLSGESGAYTCIFRTESGLTKQENLYYVSQEDKELLKTQDSYFLIDDDLNMLKANSADPLDLWGWDVLEDGGEISYSYNDFLLNDNDSSKRLTIRRSFEARSDGMVTWEFRFNQKTVQDDVKWQIRGADTAAAELLTMDGKLFLNGEVLQSYSPNTEYGIRLEMDLTLQTVSGYVNGALAANKIPLLTNGRAIDNLIISTGEADTGVINVKPVRLYRGYYVQEAWVAYTAGVIQSGAWQTSEDGSVRIEKMASTSPPDVYSAVLRDTSCSSSSFIAKQLQDIPEKTVLEFKMYSVETINDFSVLLSESLQLKINNNILYVLSPQGDMQQAVKLPTGLWNTVQIKLDSGAGIASISVNGKRLSQSFQCNPRSDISELRFTTGIDSVDTIWVDDISLKRDLPLPSDYVPMPQTRDKAEGESLVGIQTCDLWREGKHFGWDKINQDYRRKPYLGFYDDGSSEVKDWEIKFMAEHGIDFSFHCWYRPVGGTGSPIKTPRNGASIHDGYFNAQYRDKIKFAISWENGSGASTNENDFRTNIVPFWIEYYFKDSGYLLLDNKPVIGIYNVSGLIESFGEENVKAQLDYLRQACMEAGFDGAWILGVSSSGNAAVLQQFADFGFDCVYCYSWGIGSYELETQKSLMLQQKSAGVISMIPTLAMGRDDTPWRRGSGGFLTPGELKSLAEWTKEEFQPQFSADEPSSRMILLDNWNEYGEGHFFMPAELSGFNYLEAIAQVYGAPQHTDVRPTQNQINRMCRLYPQDRTVPPLMESEAPPVLPNVVRGWYFDNGTEGFIKNSQINNMTVQNGILTGVSTGTDPIVYTPSDLNIDISDVAYIRIRMRNNTNDNRSGIYFVTEQDGVYNEQKKLRWTTKDYGGEFIDYIIPAYENQYWTGVLKQLRFDPSSGIGAFAYDSIELLGGVDFIGGNLIQNGNMEQELLPQSRGAVCELTGWEYHGGIRSLLCKAEASEAELIYPITLSGERAYLASVHGRSADAETQAELWIRYLQDGVVQEQKIDDTMTMRADRWSFVGGRLELGAAEITSAQLIVKINPQDAVCYIDDIMLCEILSPILAVEDVLLTDENGEDIDAVSEVVGIVNFTARLTNLSDKEINIIPWLAAYRGEVLQEVSSGQKITLPAGASQNVRVQMMAEQPTVIKQFFWNEEQTPLKILEWK